MPGDMLNTIRFPAEKESLTLSKSLGITEELTDPLKGASLQPRFPDGITVEKCVKVAFYRGKGDWKDKVIRWATKSPYSHVEVVGLDGRAYSSSARDGGVRIKEIDFGDGKWDLVECPWMDQSHVDRIALQVGKKYDYTGLLLSQALNLSRHKRKRFFCSEIVAWAIGLGQPQRMSPGGVYYLCQLLNELWERREGPVGKTL